MDTTSVNYITFMLMDATSVNYISCDVTCNKCELHNYPPSAHQCTALHPLSVLGIRHRGLQLVLGIRHRGLQLVLGSEKDFCLCWGSGIAVGSCIAGGKGTQSDAEGAGAAQWIGTAGGMATHFDTPALTCILSLGPC